MNTKTGTSVKYTTPTSFEASRKSTCMFKFSLLNNILYLRLKWNKVLLVLVVHFACYNVSDIHH